MAIEITMVLEEKGLLVHLVSEVPPGDEPADEPADELELTSPPFSVLSAGLSFFPNGVESPLRA